MVNSITCHKCGGRGHLQRDCKFEGTCETGKYFPFFKSIFLHFYLCFHLAEGEANQSKIDEEYMSLMAELGETPLPTIRLPTQTPATNEIPDSESNSQSSAPSQSVGNPINSPADMSATSPSDSNDGSKVKNVTWMQKQGILFKILKLSQFFYKRMIGSFVF